MEVEQGGRSEEEEEEVEAEEVGERAGYFLSYWVAADWSLCHHL